MAVNRVVGTAVLLATVMAALQAGELAYARALPAVGAWELLATPILADITRRRAVVVGTRASLAGFSVVIALTPYWQRGVVPTGGFLTSLVVLPTCASMLTRQVDRSRQEAEAVSWWIG